jgi:acyl-CoA thioester hydrolase
MNDVPRRSRRIVRKRVIEPEFHQVDIMGVVHNAVYFYWFEKGRLEILWSILPFEESVRLNLALPVVRHVCNYRNAARFGDRLILTTTHELVEGYEGRLLFRHSLMNEVKKTEIAEAETTLTIMDMRTGQLVRDFPPEVWERYRALT